MLFASGEQHIPFIKTKATTTTTKNMIFSSGVNVLFRVSFVSNFCFVLNTFIFGCLFYFILLVASPLSLLIKLLLKM